MNNRLAVLAVFAVLLADLPARAEGVRLGGHWAYLAGDSFLDRDTDGYGVQLTFDVLDDVITLEVAGTKFNDNGAGLDIEMLTIQASAFLNIELTSELVLFGGGGANYHLPDIGIDLESGADIDPAFGYQAGGGLILRTGTRIEIFGDYRFVSVTFEESDASAFESFLFDYEYSMVRAGLNLRF